MFRIAYYGARNYVAQWWDTVKWNKIGPRRHSEFDAKTDVLMFTSEKHKINFTKIPVVNDW